MLPGLLLPCLRPLPAARARLNWLRPAHGSSDSHSQKCGPAGQPASCARLGRQGTPGEPGSLQLAEPAQGGTGARPDGRPILL
eukprot:12871697-Heterocapsa_arctica.AAC.1